MDKCNDSFWEELNLFTVDGNCRYLLVEILHEGPQKAASASKHEL